MSSAAAPRFIQFVSFLAKDAQAREKVLSIWRPAMEHVAASEKGSVALTYEAFVAASDSASQADAAGEVVAFETYSSEEAFQQGHMKAAAVQTFLAEMSAADVLARATEVTPLERRGGFHWRGEEREKQMRAEGKKSYAVVVQIPLKSKEEADKFLELFAPLAAYVESSEPNTLTYEIFTATADPARVLIMERYASAADLKENHIRSEAFQQFGKDLKEKMGMELPPTALRFYDELAVGHWGSE